MTTEQAIYILRNTAWLGSNDVRDTTEQAIFTVGEELKRTERKKGKWNPMFDGRFKGGAYWFSCSECGRVVPDIRNGGWGFCPNCGSFNGEGKQE